MFVMGSDQQFCLQWHNYQSSLLASLPQLLDNNDLTDVTLSAGGRNIKAHRVILAACSQYFKDLFKVLPAMQHPVIVLPGTNFTDLCALVTFMYSGEVNIYQEQLQGILTMADAMQIRGLAEVSGAAGDEMKTKKDPQCSASKRPRLSTHQTVCSSLLNQAQSETNAHYGLKPLSAGNIDVPGNFLVKGEFESYSEANQPLVNLKSSSEEIHFTSSNKNGDPKFKSGADNVDIYMGIVKSDKEKRAGLQIGTDVLRYMDDGSYSSTPPVVGSPRMFEDGHSKIDQDHHEFGCSTRESRPSLPSSGADGQKTSNPICENTDGQQSPCSEDSASSNFGVEVIAERMHLNQEPQVSTLKYSNNQYVKTTTPLHSSKLFATCMVCGKQLSNQYNLRVHMETHQNINYACRVCNHVSRSRDALRKHVSYRHPKDGKDRVMVSGNTRESNNGKSCSSSKAKIFTSNELKQEQQ